ncbi:MAG: hypothetical protein J0H09_23455 [Burkholderiales bacterium]|nr:hypothetical protein [Burkholderiales bacterium]
MKDLMIEEKGQLNRLFKVVPDPMATVDYVVCNWTKFLAKASLVAGVKAPDRPRIGFMIEHVAIAVKILQSIAKNKDPAKAKTLVKLR